MVKKTGSDIQKKSLLKLKIKKPDFSGFFYIYDSAT